MIPYKASASETGLPAAPTMKVVSEEERLEALHSYQVLDTPPEPSLDALTRLAAIICGTPISLVSLVDAERQWFKSNLGLEATPETPRNMAFCQHAMFTEKGVYEVNNATEDPLFQNNPLVTDEPSIRFYAGAPLLTPEGIPLGTLCTLHTEPHALSVQQREALTILAREVSMHLELRRTQLLLEQEKQKLEGLLKMANDSAQALYMSSRNEIFVKHEQKLQRVKITDINFIEALGDYVNIHTITERLTIYTTMKDIESKLPTRTFLRVHRKYIVQLDKINSIEADAVIIDGPKGGLEIPIGQSYRAGLMGRLNLI
ncbi:GAF domain-containing DNA-binding protein [Hymenobacter sp. DG25B]|jgi:DNA-binding LytR/AlgR family response regulator|uniref:GAF domain-containing DNA-binding protein n=1 Tax=Hymenobacter sp. DG25B TaxID=1385664 RepID=UPI000693D547|nr:GAF domain-containing DNA-binding protein [Hymenobacter sp. DG25B]